MKNFFAFLLLAGLFTACKKDIVSSVQEDLVVKAMTDGQWRVTRFTRDTADVTAGFSAYKFQFRENKTVEALANNAIESKGTWAADATAKIITASFGATAAPALQWLNGTWLITKNGWTYVEATQTVNNEVRTLRLDK